MSELEPFYAYLHKQFGLVFSVPYRFAFSMRQNAYRYNTPFHACENQSRVS